MAADWNGKLIDKESRPDAPAPSDATQPTLTDVMLRQEAERDRRRELDAKLLTFLRSPDAQDEDKTFKALDDYTRDRWGIETQRGNCWTPDRQPYANARQYADALVGVLNRGYSAIATPEYKAWIAAKESGDRNAMIKAASIETTKMTTAPNANGGLSDFADPGNFAQPSNTIEPKTDAEIDDELREYGAKIEGQNFVDTYRAVGSDFTPDEKAMVHAALKGGDGLPAEYEADFAMLLRKDVEKANRVLFCINRARRNESAFFRDLAHSFTSTWNRTYGGLQTAFEETIGIAAENSVWQEMVGQSSDSAKYYWNDSERAEYKRLTELYATNPNVRAYAMTDPRSRVNQICAARLANEALPYEEQKKKRHVELLVEEATRHVPYDNYGYLYKTMTGLSSTAAYMANTLLAPYMGTFVNAFNQFGNVRDQIIMDGGDPDEALGWQIAGAIAWSAMERFEPKVAFGKPMTNLARRTFWMDMLHTPWKQGKIKKLGKMALNATPETLWSQGVNCVQEGAQDAIEKGTVTWLTTHDLSQTIDETSKAGKQAFIDSWGVMGILGAAGAGIKSYRAYHTAYDTASLVDYTAKRLRAMNILQGKIADPDADAKVPNKAVGKMVQDVQTIWQNHIEDKTGGVAALEEITEKYHLTDEERHIVGDYLDLRANLLDTARRMDSDEQANFVASVAGGAFRVGNDTTYDPVDLLTLVNPNATVEDVEVDDRAKNPTEKPVSPETQSLRDQLAAAQERIDKAKVGSERLAAEREYRRVNRKLKAAEAAEEAPTYPKMRVRRVTVPVGTSGEKRSFTITENREGPDIHTEGYAQSVAEAMKEPLAAGVAKDGAAISVEDFKLLPIEEKRNYAVTPDEYMAMTDEERDQYCRVWTLQSGGFFQILDDKTGKEVFGTDAMVEIMRSFKNPHARVGGNWTLAHEYGHAISAFARAVGTIDTSSKSVAVMRKLFGDPTSDNELWNEEAANNAFADYLREKYDFKRLTPEERKAARGFFKNALATLRGIFSLSGRELPDAPVERTERERALDTAFEALRSGDFAGLDQFAGIDFAEDHAPAAPEAPATPSASETANPAPAAPKAPTEAPAPAPARPREDGRSVTAQFRPVAPESAPLRTGTKRTVFTPGYEMSVEADAMWVPLADLVESTDDREVQPRDRTRVATDEQILSKTRKGVFQPLTLFPGTKSDDGAPIVGGGLRIISGHGRKRMIEQLVREGRFNEYINAINAEATRQGLPTAPEDMENPVIVLRVTGGLDKREDLTRFADLSNHWGGLELSSAEHAESDARKVTDALLRLYSPDASGNLLAASNRPFMAAFMKAVNATGLTNADGTPTAEAALRVQRAMMTAIFGNDEKVRAMVQNLLERNQELSLATLQNALLKSAGKLLAMKRQRGSFDIVSDVREAAYQYIAWRSAQAKNPKLTLADHLNQSDFFTAAVPPMQQALAKLLEAGRFGATLDKYAELVAQQEIDAQETFAGIAEKRTPLQILGYAERAVLPEGETAVTPDPASPEAAAPVQTPPDVASKPTTNNQQPTTSSPLAAAQTTLTPPEPTTFKPVPVKRGTATLPGPGAKGIDGYQVDAQGKPKTAKRPLPAGAYNLTRAHYDVRHVPSPSEQDLAGRGLFISNPAPTGHADIFPKFQGYKLEMAARTSQAIRAIMPKAEREHYETVVDYFGGGGCWGLYHALENFPNAKLLVINEFDNDRIEKIRLLQELDGKVAEEAEAILTDPAIYARLADRIKGRDDTEKSTPATIAKHVEKTLLRGLDIDPNALISFSDSIQMLTDAHQRAVICAFVDCASTMIASVKDKDGKPSDDMMLGIKKAIEQLKEDGKKAKAAADEFKARGGKIVYRQGDAANYSDAPRGDKVVAVCDPPYYLTTGYNGQTTVPLHETPNGWSYETTRNLLQKLVDNGDAIVYTDEAWWHKEKYIPDTRELNGKSEFKSEQEVLLDIINMLDHFDVAGRVGSTTAPRQEVLGIHHGHDTKSESGEDGTLLQSRLQGNLAPEVGSGSTAGAAVRDVAGGAAAEARPNGGAGANRGREGEVALAREVITQDIAASIESASPATAPVTADTLARHSVRLVREERMADYARTVAKNAKRWLAKAQKDLDAHMAAHGYTEKVWHGTEGDDFNVFNFTSGNHTVPAAYFTYRRETAQSYAAMRSLGDSGFSDEEIAKTVPNVRSFYINPGKSKTIDVSGNPQNVESVTHIIGDALEQGYNTVVLRGLNDDLGYPYNPETDQFDPNQLISGKVRETDVLVVLQQPGDNAPARIKAADPVTFMDDTDGSLPVPLEMRADQSLADVRFSVTMGKRAREEARAMIEKYRPNLDGFVTNEQGKMVSEVDATVESIAAFDTPKERKAALFWVCKGTVVLPEDAQKVRDAIKTAERAHVDPFQFDRPGEILDKFNEYRPVAKPIDPDTVPELSDKRVLSNGIVTYLVQDDEQGQAAMRRIINTHFGKDASPWCLLQGDGEGNLSYSAWDYWRHYNALPKRVAFRNGKLVAFMATDNQQEWNIKTHDYDAPAEQWWDRADEPHDGIPFSEKDGEGRTLHQELYEGGQVVTGKITRGDPKAKDGTYEEWRGNGIYEKTVSKNGRAVSLIRIADGVTISEEERVINENGRNPLRLYIGRDFNGTLMNAYVEDETKGYLLSYGDGWISASAPSGISVHVHHSQIGDEAMAKAARDLFAALKANDLPAVDAIVADLKARATTAQPRFSVRTAWRPDFPKAMAQTTRANIMAKYADLFNRAKAGDPDAAADLIEKVVKPEKVRELVRGHGKATIVMPIHAEEATGDNKLPIAYATYISDMTGLDYDDGIVQSVRAHHTGAGAERRLFVNPEFDGEVKRGREYIIVDDHITQGGTVNAMRDYIESHGGRVVAVSALTLSQGSSILSPRKDTIDEIKRKWPDINRLLRTAGIADRVEALTESQCRYIQKFSADTFRARCLASGREGGVGVLPQPLGASASEVVAREETEAERAAMRHSVFVGTKAAVKGAADFDELADAETTLHKKFHDKYTPEARDEIYRKTGWWKGTDDKWRFEIRDVKPKKRGKTLGDTCINGLYHYGDSSTQWCPLTDMVSHVKLFKAYPKLKDITVDIVDPDSVDFNAQYDPNRNRITINWDGIEWYDDEPSNVLNDDGLSSLTHELQHAVQHIENFAKGGSPEYHGERNYGRLAGEVEARNAAYRIGLPFSQIVKGGVDEREAAMEVGAQPWATEDVPTAKQIIADEYGSMTDVRGRPVARHSVRRASNAASPRDLATALIASRRLAGKDMKPEDYSSLVTPRSISNSHASAQGRLSRPSARTTRFSLNSDNAERVAALVGAVGILRGETLTDRSLDAIRRSVRASISIPDLRREAERLADENRRVLNYVAHDKKISRLVARAGLGERMQKAIDRSRQADLSFAEGVRRKTERINRSTERVIRDTQGFTADTMLNELGIDPASLLLSLRPAERAQPERTAPTDAEQTADAPHALDPALMQAAQTKAAELIGKAREAVARAKVEQEKNPVEIDEDGKRRDEREDAAGEEEDGDEIVGTMMQNAILAEIKKSGITLDNAAEMVKLAEVVTEDYIRNHASQYQGIDLNDVWEDPRARALLGGNISRFAQMAAGAYCPTFTRERVAKKAQMLDDKAVRSLQAIEEIGVHMFEDLNRDLIRETRKDLIRQIHRKIDNLARKHNENTLNEERKVSSAISGYLKKVKKAIDMSAAKVEERIAELETLCTTRYQGLDEEKGTTTATTPRRRTKSTSSPTGATSRRRCRARSRPTSSISTSSSTRTWRG